MMDGVYATHPKQGRGMHFVRVPTPSTEEVGFLVAKIARKSERWLGKQGYESNEDWNVEASDALPLFQEASIAGGTATGSRRGMKIRRVQKFGARAFQLLCTDSYKSALSGFWDGGITLIWSTFLVFSCS
jgi:hypothetical protein